MKKILVLLAILPVFVFAQKSTAYWSLGGFVGTLNYNGEITEEGDIGTWINEMRPEFGVRLMRHFNNRSILGAEASYGSIYASDENRGNEGRRFVMDTEVAQINLIYELNFKRYGKYFQRNANTPFIRVGIGGLFYTPKLDQNGVYPDSLELFRGSFATYNFQAAFGWKWRISYHSSLAVDIHYHFTGTSHLEGYNVKDIANPNDAIYGIRLTYSYGFFN